MIAQAPVRLKDTACTVEYPFELPVMDEWCVELAHQLLDRNGMDHSWDGLTLRFRSVADRLDAIISLNEGDDRLAWIGHRLVSVLSTSDEDRKKMMTEPIDRQYLVGVTLTFKSKRPAD